MVFRKYKPVTQWGKQDTRIFKAILNARNARKMPSFTIPQAVQDLGVKVHDPTEASFFASSTVKAAKREQEKRTRATSASNRDATEHPLYNDVPCRLFDGEEPMSDGIDQACLLTKAILRTDFPESVLKNALVNFDEEKVRDAIMHGERYDPTLEKLPRRFDPVLFWVTHPRVHGTPVIKRGNIIMHNLLRHIILRGMSLERVAPFGLTVSTDEPFSATIQSKPHFNENAFVLRGLPYLTVHSRTGRFWADANEVGATSEAALPDISPLSPLIDLKRDHLYNKTSLMVERGSGEKRANAHCILWTREQNQKYPWTTEQNAANAILSTFGAAAAEAQKRKIDGGVVMRGVQLVDGRLDLVAFQLNTLDLSDANPIKNVVWLQKGIQLYKPRPFYEEFESVQKLNMKAFEQLSALLLS